METTIIPLRIKKSSPTLDSFNISNIEILLRHQTPIITKILLDVEPNSFICSFLQSLLPPPSYLKVKRTVCIPDDNISLFCVPVEMEDEMFDRRVSSEFTFLPLDSWLSKTLQDPHTHPLALKMNNWLGQRPQLIQLLFCKSADDCFRWSITNPAYPDGNMLSAFDHLSSQSISPSLHLRRSCREKAILLDRCDLFKSNPLFGSKMSFQYKVDRLVRNRAWDNNKDDTITNLNTNFNNLYFRNKFNDNNNMDTLVSINSYNKNNNNNNNVEYETGFNNSYDGSPDYVQPSFLTSSVSRKQKKQTHHLHQQVRLNSLQGVMECLSRGFSPLDPDGYFDTPLHLAAELGHIDILKVMLEREGINSLNYHSQSLLHVACINNQSKVVEFLLKNDANVNLKDKQGKTALQYCQEGGECSKKLLRYLQQPLATIDIHLMDCSYRKLTLPSHADTTVAQLHRLMMKELQLPEDCAHLFSIWICSRNLQLQLTKEQKPIQQLNDWKTLIVAEMTDHPPDKEDPELYWRRDVLLSIKMEALVTNQIALNLLFAEAYHNYIKSFYLCSEEDVVLLSGFIMQLVYGNFKANFSYFDEEGVLETLVPAHVLPKDSRKSWCKKIINQYQIYSSSRTTKTANTMHHKHFLKICRQLITYGCAFFIGVGKYKKKTTQIFVGINDLGCQILESLPRRLIETFKYSETDWKLVTTSDRRKELVLRKKKAKKNEYVIVSKQAGLIDNLMRRLSGFSDPK